MWKEIKQQRKQDLTHIQSRLPDFLTLHLVRIDPLQRQKYEGKLVSFNGSTPSTSEHPVVHSQLADHHIIHGSSTELNPIEIHAVVDVNSFPPSLYEKMDRCTHRLSFLDFNSSEWVDSTWLLALSFYGVMDTTTERSTEVIQMVQSQLQVRTASNRTAKIQLGKSVSISQAQPNQRGYIDATRNIPARRHKDPGEGLAIPLNEHTPTVRSLWAYALNSL
ncbi:hypothetical protein FN846DRAFT_896222 [Sphaerosporella brunnea]|uniref:Uncharacterized protein n=1 Tax=Sphaerosporella brunnea TaxID=1250544 RepID=A0A5J5EDU2_9PEZI|nr:hypothetical protein FN846DRAFT_896222 [Sphaerosporella brunnea]